jgi:hypothetical protein
MWVSLLSGGHATYGGLKTYEPYDRKLSGVQGYFDAVAAGKLEHGADDFVHIHKFFTGSGLTLVNMKPDDVLVGNQPERFKCIHDDRAYIIYLANPDNSKPGEANVGRTVPDVVVQLPDGKFSAKWFSPRTGQWTDGSGVPGVKQTLRAPGDGDWILLLKLEHPKVTQGSLRIHSKSPTCFATAG